MAFIHHHHRPDHAQGVAQRILHHGEQPGISGQIGRAVQSGLVRLLFAFRWEEAVYVAPVLKHLQRVLGFPVGGLQHQQHDAQVGFHQVEFHVAGVQPVGFFP